MEKFSRMWRSGISLMLVLCMLISMCPITAFAEENTNEINYVSIGDSMANGYGFVGYGQGGTYDFFNGKNMYGADAYPLQFEEYLVSKGYAVNHTKLAPSALLAEDLLYLLDGREEFDDGWSGYKDYVSGISDSQLKPHFQKAIAEADVITMGIGNASFGAFMLDRVTSALGVFGASLEGEPVLNFEQAIGVLELDSEQYALATELYGMMKSKLVDNVPSEYVEQFNLDQVLDIVSYTAASYIVNYKLLVEKIVEMNPDVEIVLVGLLNTTYGMNITDENGNTIVAFGDMMDMAFKALNAYMAGLPAVLQAQGAAGEAEFYYAEQPSPKFICQVFDDLHANGWGDIQNNRLSGKTVRERNIQAYNSNLAEMIGYAVAGKPLPRISLDDIAAYNNINWDALAANGINPWGGLITVGYPNSEASIDLILSVAIYLAIEEAVANSTDTLDIPLSGLLKIAGDLSSVFTDLGTPPTDSPEASRAWLLNGLSTPEIQGMCKVYGLFKVGNGMSVHPTPEGHDEIARSVIAAYDGKYTAKAETIKNLKEVANIALGLVNEYYDEAYAMAYAKAAEAGYIDAAAAAIDGVMAEILEISKMELPADTTDAFKAEVAASIQEVLETLGAAKALLAEADVLDQAALNALMGLLTEAAEDIAALVSALEQAGIDANQLAILPALKAAYSKLVNEINTINNNLMKAVKAGTDWLMEKLGNTYDELVGFITRHVETYAPELCEFVENWLQDNAAALFALMQEHGEKFVDFLNDNIQQIVEVLKYVVVTYGQELANTILKNADEILTTLVDLVKKYGDEAWALINGELEALGLIVTDVLNSAMNGLVNEMAKFAEQIKNEILSIAGDTIKDLQTAVDALIKQVKAQLATATGEAKAKLEAVLKAAEDLKAGLEALVNGTAADIYDAIAKIEAAIENLNAAIAESADVLSAEALKALKALLGNICDMTAELIEIATESILKYLGDTYGEVVAALLDAVKAVTSDVDAWLYDWFYTHPATVIAFINEYGEKMLDFLKDYVEEAALVLGYVLINYGEDIAEYIMNRADEILTTMAKWYAEYGEKTWAMIEKYLDELGVLDIIEDVKDTIENVQDAINYLTEMLDKVAPAIKEGLLEITAETAKTLYEIADSLIKLIETEIKTQSGIAKEKLEALYNAAVQLKEAAEKAITDGINAAAAEVQAALSALIEATENAVAVVSKETAAKINKLVNDAKAQLNQAYIDATHATYVSDENSYYVALGDDTAVSESYVDLLAAELGLTVAQYKNLAKKGMQVGDLANVLKANVADIAKADLITIGFGNDTFMHKAIYDAVNGSMGEAIEYDWAAVVTEDGVPYVEQALAKVREELVKAGLDIESPELQMLGMQGTLADIMMLVVEAYAYSTVSYTVGLPAAIDAIHKINPEAQVIIVGMYNPLEGAVINYGELQIPVAEYMDYLVDAAMVHSLAYSMITGNAIYVDAPAVETDSTVNDKMAILQFIMYYVMDGNVASLPNADGHEYIKTQILNALTVTKEEEPKGLWGDADGNGEVNSKDASLILQYDAKMDVEDKIDLVVSDVNGDGAVNSKDASLVLQFDALMIPEFPVDKAA